VVLGWLTNNNYKKTNVSDNTSNTLNLVAENGSRTRTILPDGSTVWLNAGSHISFVEGFSAKQEK
jgi:ferric-dicitrate binding protein FerR (iron transport regulator)